MRTFSDSELDGHIQLFRTTHPGLSDDAYRAAATWVLTQADLPEDKRVPTSKFEEALNAIIAKALEGGKS